MNILNKLKNKIGMEKLFLSAEDHWVDKNQHVRDMIGPKLFEEIQI